MDVIEALREAVEEANEENMRLQRTCNKQSAELDQLRTELKQLRWAARAVSETWITLGDVGAAQFAALHDALKATKG